MPERDSEPNVGRLAFALGAITLALFLPALGHEFVKTDDNLYVTAQPMVQQGLSADSFVWAFTNVSAANWHPITWLSHMLDCELYGLNPRGHHFTSILIHSANAALLFLLLWRWTGSQWRSAIVAALFAWHPLRVESVVWVAERKDVLSCFFGLLALWTYREYARTRSAGRYIQTLSLYACSLMSKATLVTLPFALLLLDYWPLKRFGNHEQGRSERESVSLRRLFAEKAPFLAVALAVCAVTIWAQSQADQVQSIEALPIGLRLANAVSAYCAYIGQTFYPSNLALFYPMPESYSGFRTAISFAGLAAVTSAGFLWARRHPYFLTGWLWYLGVLVPVIGIVQVSVQARADRYTYLPHIGLFIAVVWSVAELNRGRTRNRRLQVFGLGALALGLILMTSLQIRHWKNSESLYRQSIRATRDNDWAHNALGSVLYDLGRLDEARAQFLLASRIQVDQPRFLYNLGVVCERQHDHAGAVFYFEKTVELSPNRADVRVKLAIVLSHLGRSQDALAQFAKAAELEPGLYSARLQLGNALAESGQYEKAEAEYRAALDLAPATPALLTNLAAVLNAMERYDQAASAAGRALTLNRSSPDARYHLAVALAGQGQIEEAVSQFGRALAPARQQGRADLARRIEQRLRALDASPAAPNN